MCINACLLEEYILPALEIPTSKYPILFYIVYLRFSVVLCSVNALIKTSSSV